MLWPRRRKTNGAPVLQNSCSFVLLDDFGLTFIPEQRLQITGIERSQVQYEFLYFTFRVLNATVVLVSFTCLQYRRLILLLQGHLARRFKFIAIFLVFLLIPQYNHTFSSVPLFYVHPAHPLFVSRRKFQARENEIQAKIWRVIFPGCVLFALLLFGVDDQY